VARQLEQIDELLRLGVDALIIGPAASHELVPAIARADDLGVPTILLGSRVPTDRYTVLVETDDVLVGKVAAEDLVRRMGPRGKVVIFEGPEGWAVADDRSRGMDLVLREYRDIVVVARRRTPQWSRARAKAMMRELLREHPRIDGVLAHDGLMMAGALEAAEEVGRANEMTFAWVGGYHGALRYIERTGQGTAALIPSWIGAECVRVALQVLRGEPVPKWRDMGTVIVNRDNLYDWYDPEKPDDTYESLLDR
jgi:ribose transport system substrate-binding protein